MPKPDLFTLNLSGMNSKSSSFATSVANALHRSAADALDAVLLAGDAPKAVQIVVNASALDSKAIFKSGDSGAKSALEDARKAWGKVLKAALRMKNASPTLVASVAELAVERVSDLSHCSNVGARLNPSDYEIANNAQDFVELAELCQINGVESGAVDAMEKHENDEISAIGKVLRFAIAKFRLRTFETCVSRPGMFSKADNKASYEKNRQELTRDSVESAEAVVVAFSKGQVPSNA